MKKSNSEINFKVSSPYNPAGDQEKAIDDLSSSIENGNKYQTLLGVTGSGKTYTMAKVIEKTKKPTLIMTHNKTLAAQLYSEFKAFFPKQPCGVLYIVLRLLPTRSILT